MHTDMLLFGISHQIAKVLVNLRKTAPDAEVRRDGSGDEKVCERERERKTSEYSRRSSV